MREDTRKYIQESEILENLSNRGKEIEKDIFLLNEQIKKLEKELKSNLYLRKKIYEELCIIIGNYQPELDNDEKDENLIKCEKCKKYFPISLTVSLLDDYHNRTYNDYCYKCDPFLKKNPQLGIKC